MQIGLRRGRDLESENEDGWWLRTRQQAKKLINFRNLRRAKWRKKSAEGKKGRPDAYVGYTYAFLDIVKNGVFTEISTG